MVIGTPLSYSVIIATIYGVVKVLVLDKIGLWNLFGLRL